MKQRKIKFEYDVDTDAAYLSLTSEKVAESEEVDPGLIVDFDNRDQIVGIEILRFAERFQRKTRQRKLAS